MFKTAAILHSTAHRPIPLPQRSWKYYQEWADTVFLHYKVPAQALQELLPYGLEPDVLDGQAWVSIVAFTVKNMRLKFLPPMPYASDFHEVNLRTYVVRNGVPGIYFITIETNKLLTALFANAFIGLNYKKALLNRRRGSYTLRKSNENNQLAVKYITLTDVREKSIEDKWLTERYCAYEEINGQMYRFNIHHKPWPLKKIKLRQLKVQYQKQQFVLFSQKPDKAHFAHSQEVLLWGREKC
jgi:uncharacterized protein YqjF (DUF2071 family)